MRDFASGCNAKPWVSLRAGFAQYCDQVGGSRLGRDPKLSKSTADNRSFAIYMSRRSPHQTKPVYGTSRALIRFPVSAALNCTAGFGEIPELLRPYQNARTFWATHPHSVFRAGLTHIDCSMSRTALPKIARKEG